MEVYWEDCENFMAFFGCVNLKKLSKFEFFECVVLFVLFRVEMDATGTPLPNLYSMSLL